MRDRILLLSLAAALALPGCAEVASGPFKAAPSAGGTAGVAEEGVLQLEQRAFADNVLMRFEAAESRYRESALRSADDATGGGAILQSEQELYLALNKSNLGEYQIAEDLFVRTVARIEASGSIVSRVKAALFYAQHHLNQGKTAEALAEVRRGIRLGEAALARGAADPRVDGLSAQPAAFVREGGSVAIPPETARLLAGSQASSLSGDVSTGQLTAAEQLAVLLAQSHYVAAAALPAGEGGRGAELDRAAEYLEQVPQPIALWLRAEVARARADELARQGALAEAVAESGRAVRIARRFAAGERPEALMRLQSGELALAAGRTEQARGSYREALSILARGGRGVSFDSLAPYLDLLAQDPDSAARSEEVFRTLQQLRNPVTSDTLARLAARLGAGTSEAAVAIRALQDSERSVNREAARLDVLTAQNPRDINAIRITRQRLDEARAAFAQAQADVARAAPNYQQIVDRSISLADFQADLRPGELFVQVRLGRRGGAVMAVTQTGFRFERIDLDVARAEDLVTRIRDSVYSPFFDVPAARELYTRVFDPIAAEMAAADAVIYAPDGPLLSLPPSLMVAGDASGYREGSLDYSAVPWFGTQKAVSVTLSVASFHQLRQVAPSQAREPFRGFGAFRPFGPGQAPLVMARRSAPTECLPVLQQLGAIAPLAGTEGEVRRVADIAGAGPEGAVLGAAFTDSALKSAPLEDVRVLHFATHGLLPISTECLPEPSLVTSLGPDAGDGLLEAGEIVELRLDADLVVLSACDTGGRGAPSALGTGFRSSGGESLSGLVRAFFYAGARNVVASHWLVPDNETVELMLGLYAGLSASRSPAEAMRESRSVLAGQPETSHPFYWAAFTVIGDAARVPPTATAAAAGQVRLARNPARPQ